MTENMDQSQAVTRIQEDAKIAGAQKMLGVVVSDFLKSEIPIVRGISKAVESFRSERDKQIHDSIVTALSTGDLELTSELMESDSFLHGVAIVVQAARRTRVQQKQRILALLLKGSLNDAAVGDMDEFEELVRITEDLSLREMKLLLAVAKETNKHTAGVKGFALRRNDNEPRQPAVEDEFGLTPQEAHGLLKRLEGKGLVSSYPAGQTYNQFDRWETSGLFDTGIGQSLALRTKSLPKVTNDRRTLETHATRRRGAACRCAGRAEHGDVRTGGRARRRIKIH